MIQAAIRQVMEGKHLDFETTKTVMQEIMEGRATQAQMGALLAALRMKGETVEEITACASVMREKGIKMRPSKTVMDIVGTGGDGTGTFNISTTAAFVVAAGGIPVAKHGNRGVSSRCGAADVLETMGINLHVTPEENEKVLDRVGICFLFAQNYHRSMQYAAPVRKEMGVRTIFNVLGPLSNPAAATMQLMGVYDQKLVSPLAQVLINLGVVRGIVVNGGDGMDEFTLTRESHICEIRQGNLYAYTLTPEQLGYNRCSMADLAGGSPKENAQITLGILEGRIHGPRRDVVVLNAAMGLYIGREGSTLKECAAFAEELLDRKKALEILTTLRDQTRRAS